MESVLPAILLEFRTRFPEVHLTLEEATTADQVRMLRDNSLDVGMVRMPLDDAGLDLREILSEPIIAALPRTHRLARRRELELRHLAEESFVAIPRSREPGLYDLCVSACRQAGFSPRFAEEALSLHSLLGLVAGGLGVALVPRSVQNLQRTGVVYKPLRDTKFQLRLAIATRHGESGGTVMRLLDLVQQMAPTLERSETTAPA
jgi:DNA-binding transcriptional LysR family regulator